MAGDVYTASGTKYYIGPAAAKTVDTLAEFIALDTGGAFKEIGLVEDGGEYGDSAALITFAALGDARIRASKGARDAGELPLIVGDDPTDEGQIALVAAEATNLNYAFKVVSPNRLNPTGTDEIEYFRVLVSGKRKRVGTNDNIVRRTFTAKINSAIYSQAPTAGV